MRRTELKNSNTSKSGASARKIESHIRLEIAKQNSIPSAVYRGNLHTLFVPRHEQEELFEESKVKRESNFKSIWERRRKTFLRWLSLVLIEPCLIRWESPDRYLERHEFESLESRSPFTPTRFF